MGKGSSKVDSVEKYREEPDEVAMKLVGRKCTDVLFLLLLVAFWLGMFVVAAIGLLNGDPAKLLMATDYDGNSCGSLADECVDEAGDCGKYGAFPRIAEDVYQFMQSGKVYNALDIPIYTVCVDKCPEKGDWVCNYAMQTKYTAAQRAAKLDDCYTQQSSAGGILGAYMVTDPECKELLTGCFKQLMATTDFLYRCLPQELSNATCSFSTTYPGLKKPDGSLLLAADKECGECIDPKYKAGGASAGRMPPSNKACKVRKVYSQSVEEKEGGDEPNPIMEQLGTMTAVVTSIAGDVSKSLAYIVLCGVGLAVVGGWAWIVVLRYFTGIFVWSVVFGFQGFLVLVALQMLIYGKVIDFSGAAEGTGEAGAEAAAALSTADVFGANTAGKEETYATLGYIMSGVAGVFLIVLAFMFKRIRIGVRILQEACKAIATMPALLFFPACPLLACCVLYAYTVWVGAYVMSAGAVAQTELVAAGSTFSESALTRRLQVTTAPTASPTAAAAALSVAEYTKMSTRDLLTLYHFFGFLWMNAFVTGVTIMSVAGAVCHWYWTLHRETEREKGAFKKALRGSVWRTLRYHAGTVAFGALVIAIVQFVRACLAYLDKQTQGLQKKNAAMRLMFKVIQCCLWCFEKSLKFLMKNAYILTAMNGSNFCSSAKKAFGLILANIAQMAVVSFIQFFLMTLGKLLILAGCVAIGFFLIDGLEGDARPRYVTVPLLLIAVIAYFTACHFLAVFDVCVSTILLCFCEDRKKNDGSMKSPYYMPKSLQKAIGVTNKNAKTAAESEKDEEDEDSTKYDTKSGKGKKGKKKKKKDLYADDDGDGKKSKNAAMII